MVNLFVETVPKHQCICESEPMRFHRMPFLHLFEYNVSHVERLKTHPVMLSTNTFR